MSRGRLSGENYRGLRLPLSLGLVLAGAATAGTVGLALVARLGEGPAVGAAGWGALGASLLVFAAGLTDDLAPIGPRGLRGHLRALASGHMTTGILKMLVAVAVSLVTVALQPVRPFPVELAGVVTMAGCANLWNGLDVAPGRALKAFLVAAAAVVAGAEWRLAPTLPVLLVGAPAVLPLDLRERAMLGDGGSNLLGFTAGLGLYLALPGWGVAVAAVTAVLLNVLAETVTLTRLIEAVPPLRWADRLGRLRRDE